MIDTARHRIYLVSFCFICYCFYSSAQNNYKHYTSSDGLQHDVTYNILQDSKGYVWIGTDDGLSKFDGKDFKNFSLDDGLTSNYVMDIEELPDGKYAIATWGGGLHFLDNDSIYKNSNFKDFNARSYDIKYFDDKIYTATSSSVSVYDFKEGIYTTKMYSNDSNSFIDGFLKSSNDYQKLTPIFLDNSIYVHNKEPSKNNFKGVKQFLNEYKLKPAFPFLSELVISSALEVDNDSYVFASEHRLLFSNSETIIKDLGVENIHIEEDIVKILKAPKTENVYLLLVRNKKGEKRLMSIDIETKLTIDIDRLIGLNSTVSDAMFDFENNLWISTFGDGIYCYYYSSPKIKTLLEGNYIIDILKENNSVYALTSYQLYKFNNDTLIKKIPIDAFAKQLTHIDGQIIISALNTEPKSFSNFKMVNGRFYRKTKLGSVRQSDTIFINEKPILITNELLINFVKAYDDSIDIYTNKGKWIYNLKNQSFTKETLFEIGLPSEKVNDLVIKDSLYYIATDKGLVLKKGNSIKVYNSDNGLKNERLNCVLLKDSVLYLGTQAGLSVIRNDKVYNYSKSFGIQSLAVHKIVELDNELWLAGNNGVSVISLKDIKPTNPPKLKVKQKDAKFWYEVISYFDHKSILSQYRINKNDWQILGDTKGSLEFDNYSIDDYTIEFRAQNSHSDWIYSPVFSFSIQPPWYQLWWVILSGFLFIASLIAIGFTQRIKRISKRNKVLKNEIAKRIIAENELNDVRDNIARDFHDDLGNKLASISLLSDVLASKVDSEKLAMAKTIKDDADYLYKGTRDFIFSLQEKSNYIEEVVIYLSDFAEDYLYQFDIDIEVHSNIDANLRLPYYWSKQIIFIFKEAITNTAKHSNAKNAKMTFSFSDKVLTIQFSDDGKGYDKDVTKFNGINNMISRARRIDCTLEINALINRGVQITFEGKLPN